MTKENQKKWKNGLMLWNMENKIMITVSVY